MTGITFEVELDDAAARAQLEALVGRMERPLPFYTAVGGYLTDEAVPRNFDQERSPGGIPWARLMPSTVANRERKGQVPIRVLTASRRLRGSITSRPSDHEVRVGSPVPYAAIHQFGGMAGRGRNVRIPGRPYLGISTEDQEEIIAIARRWLERE